ncbi:hypothetical protein NLX83_23570 [Allokutzneria sp. A3M-2-11 16]|uniref:hypothetical protein n=1 Tax=Allokutzneria sp. A3M-2-11 16 TaxID=2962043 RepID=UPI0020B6DC8A|nr:hypothetical protein [Allokutzneria sp. A3M-2-11 16]MCP3802253.1 hypothetical protein [Allokutzneria sp. A3M-2-11 16]
MDTEAIITELYGLEPREFTAARNGRVAEAKQEGDAEAAEVISAQRKPSTAAWLVNRLVREHSEEVDGLLELGVDLRAAHTTLDGAKLRELGQRRHRTVRELIKLAAGMHSLSASVERELEESLTTALSDPDAAAVLEAGRLTTTLRLDDRASWPEVTAALPVKRAKQKPRPDKKKLAEAEGAFRAAEAECADARREVDAARERLAAAEERLDEARAKVERLKRAE